MAQLVCRELTKIFDDKTALNDINLDLEFSGLGMMGPNGSGKTTLVNLLLGIIRPSYGSIDIDVPLTEVRVVRDQPNLPWKMSIDQWIYTLEKFYGDYPLNIDIQTDLGLEGHWKIENLSAGQKRKVAFLPVFYGEPELIIVDEPSNYLDITTRDYLLRLLKKHCDDIGASIMLSSHNMEELRLFASHVILLNEGRLMTTTSLEKDAPLYYAIKSTDTDHLADQLSLRGVLHFEDETINGHVLKVEASEELWQVIQEMDRDGEKIVYFRTIDTLERMIEDLTE